MASLYERSGEAILRALLCTLCSFSDTVSGSAVRQAGQAYSSSDLIRDVKMHTMWVLSTPARFNRHWK